MSHHWPQCAKWLWRYPIPKSGIWARWMRMECQKQKIKILCHLTFVIHIQWKLYVKDKFCILLNFNYTLLNVNYVSPNKYCTLLKVDYMFDVNCKLSCEHFMVLNSYYTFLVRQNYIWSTDLKIETFWNYIWLKKATCRERPASISEEPMMQALSKSKWSLWGTELSILKVSEIQGKVNHQARGN